MKKRSFLPILLLSVIPLLAEELPDYTFRGGESIYRVSLLEPLGEGGFYGDMRAQFLKMEVDTTSFEMGISLAYGVLPNLDCAFHLPYIRMTNGIYNKYGLGDGMFSLKYYDQGQEPSLFRWGIEGAFMLPTGYSEDISGFPRFTLDQFGWGGRYLAGLHEKHIDLTGNIGAFWSETGTISQMFYGFGADLHLLGKLLSLQGEIASAQGINNIGNENYAYAGLHSQLPYIGLGFHAGIESLLKSDRPNRLVVGLSLTSRKTIPGVSKGILETKKRYKKLMVFDFVDEEPGFTDYDLKQRFCRKLGSLEDITIMEPADETPQLAYRDRLSALTLTTQDSADLLIFARFQNLGYERNHGFIIPWLISLPITRAFVTADVWVVDTQTSEQIFTGKVTGRASKLRGVALFQPNRSTDNIFLTAQQSDKLRKKAVDDLLKEMGMVFSDKLK